MPMITLKKKGEYALIETHGQTKILTLDNKKSFAWITAEDIGEILVVSRKTHIKDHVLALGKYRLYDVVKEPNLTDLQHLELLVGEGKWQGYLLLNGLPRGKRNKKRIIPTNELITQVTA